MKSGRRDSLGSLWIAFGSLIYLGSNLVGYGWRFHPDPMRGLLLAAMGMMLCSFALALAPDVESRGNTCMYLKVVLVLGGGSLLLSLGGQAVRPFYDLFNARWGAIPPPAMIFGPIYGLVSLGGLMGIELWSAKHMATETASH